jgi:hypothetical protein
VRDFRAGSGRLTGEKTGGAEDENGQHTSGYGRQPVP